MAKDDWYTDKETAADDQAGANRGGRMKCFQKDGNKKTDVKIETTTVMFIPSTRGGLLTSMMRERETEMSRITRFKVKMKESGGIQLAILFGTDLAKGQPCGRQDCQPCNGGEGRTNCKKTSVLYESKCTIWNPDQHNSRSSGRKRMVSTPEGWNLMRGE